MPHPLISPTLVQRIVSVVAVAFASSLSFAAEHIVEPCDMGPAPDSPEFKRYYQEREALRAQLGYYPVCEQWIPTLLPDTAEPYETVRTKLAFQPLSLDGTPFAQFRLLGASADHPDSGTDIQRAAALRRYFAGARGELFELFEWDTSLDGGGVYFLDSARQTERVKGQIAHLTILQSTSGKAISKLSWDANRRHIELSVNRNVRKEGYSQFVSLAESLPDATPARPDAPMPKVEPPPPFGPGPSFPPHLPR